jgi:glycosyltransferase involved in cell wall biosynthesis
MTPTLPGSVWHVISNRWNSAITEYALSSARSLKERGWETCFSPLLNSPAEERSLAHGLDTRPFSSFGVQGLMRFRRLFKEINPDVIITYGGPETSLLRILGKGNVKKFRFRGREREETRPLFKLRYKVNSSHLDGIISPSVKRANFFKTLSNISVWCVTLGCDTGKVHRVPPAGIRAEFMEMVLLGRFDPVKGHEKFFSITRKLIEGWPENRPKPLLHIVGKPANISREEIEAMGERAGLKAGTDFIITTEWMENIAELMSRATLGVIPSLGSEVICRVGEEFLLCGTPILVSGVGSSEEILFEGAGLSYAGVSAVEVVSLTRELLILSYDENEAAKKARAAQARDLFSLDAMGENLEKIIL